MQSEGSDREAAMREALDVIPKAPKEEASRLAQNVLSTLDASDEGKLAQQLVELNLALGNTAGAAYAAIESALVDQRRGDYKVRALIAAPPASRTSCAPAAIAKQHLAGCLMPRNYCKRCAPRCMTRHIHQFVNMFTN